MKINFIYDPNVNYAQMIGYEIAALMWGQLFTDDIDENSRIYLHSSSASS